MCVSILIAQIMMHLYSAVHTQKWRKKKRLNSKKERSITIYPGVHAHRRIKKKRFNSKKKKKDQQTICPGVRAHIYILLRRRKRIKQQSRKINCPGVAHIGGGNKNEQKSVRLFLKRCLSILLPQLLACASNRSKAQLPRVLLFILSLG